MIIPLFFVTQVSAGLDRLLGVSNALEGGFPGLSSGVLMKINKFLRLTG